MDKITNHGESFWEDVLQERDKNKKWLEDRFYEMDFQGIYLGDEMNTFHFDWDSAIADKSIDDIWRIAFMNMIATKFTFSAPGLMLFYEQLHAMFPDWIIERTLCPPTERNRELMKTDGIRPFAVESKMPLHAYNVICMSIDLTGSAVSVPWILLESGIPVHAYDRGESDPFVILGGSALVNPKPFQPFADILFFGEGEEILPELLSMIREGKSNGIPKKEILLNAARRWDCLYIPCFYEEHYDSEGRFYETVPLRNDVPSVIHFNRIADMDNVFIPTKPFINFCTIPSDNSHYEISRGCEGKCSFCMPGFTSLPFRPRSGSLVLDTIQKIIYETGNTSVVPVSFNSVSHPDINLIISGLNDMIEDKIKLISLRMDGFSTNPELCCFISMQTRGRISFGVEGSSQRLRNMVSKNLTEERILNTMHTVCKSGYGTIKFMMICGLPNETDADLEELYNLAVKIRNIFEQETPPGNKIPILLITWNALLCSPHTPLQWAGVPGTLSPAYENFTQKIKELGFSTFTPEISIEHPISHLFIRGDERISEYLLFLAKEGHLRHNDPYGKDVYDKTVRFLEDNNYPPIDEWLKEYRYEDPLPWDIVQGPVSKDYLYKRYREKDNATTSPDPVCTSKCSGCGACEPEQLVRMASIPAKREKDRMIDLHHPVKKTPFNPVSYVLLEYTYDSKHSVLLPIYWDCEIRRALFHADILFDPDSVASFGNDAFEGHIASGSNVTCVSLGKNYDINELQKRIDAQAVNFKVLTLTEIDRPVRVKEVTYRMKLPEGVPYSRINEQFENMLSRDEWNTSIIRPGHTAAFTIDLRRLVSSAEIRDNHLVFTTGPVFASPELFFRYTFSIPEDRLLYQIPERIGYTYENQGVLDKAKTRGTRDAFLRYKKDSEEVSEDDYNALFSYISSSDCVRHLKRLIQRKYKTMPPALLELIDFTARDCDNEYLNNDPAYTDLMNFRGSLNHEH